jgi:hypothetical protein
MSTLYRRRAGIVFCRHPHGQRVVTARNRIKATKAREAACLLKRVFA